MRSWWLPLTFACLMAGCSEDPPAAVAPVVEPVVVEEDPWMGSDRIEVAGFHFNGMEFDTPACTNGGASTTAPEFPRTALVHAGAGQLEFTVSAEATMMGVQVGYKHGDDEDYTWLPVVTADTKTFTIPVSSAQWEVPEPLGEDEIAFADDEEYSWAFNHRINLPEPADQDCWTGGGTGRFDVTVEAVKGA